MSGVQLWSRINSSELYFLLKLNYMDRPIHESNICLVIETAIEIFLGMS